MEYRGSAKRPAMRSHAVSCLRRSGVRAARPVGVYSARYGWLETREEVHVVDRNASQLEDYPKLHSRAISSCMKSTRVKTSLLRTRHVLPELLESSLHSPSHISHISEPCCQAH